MEKALTSRKKSSKQLKELASLNPNISSGQTKGIETLLGSIKASAGLAFGATALTLGSPALAIFAPLIDRCADALVPSFEKDLITERIALLHKCILEQESRLNSLEDLIANADASIRLLDQTLNSALSRTSHGAVYDLIRQSVRMFENADDRTHESLIRLIAFSLIRGPDSIDSTKQMLDAVLSLSDSDKYVFFKILHDIPDSDINIERLGDSGFAIGGPITFSTWRIRLKQFGISEQALQHSFLNRLYNAGLVALTNPNELQLTQLGNTALTTLLKSIVPRTPDGLSA